MEKYQRDQLSIALLELEHDDEEQKNILKTKLMNIRMLQY